MLDRAFRAVTRGEWLRLGGALVLGAALAFPAGIWVTRSDQTVIAPTPPTTAASRAMFSPSIRSDPYFLGRQREGVEALEAHCRRTSELCAEARAARRRIEQLRAGQSREALPRSKPSDLTRAERIFP